MRSKLFAHLRAQWAGLLALFLVIAGGTAYAADTIFSTDIVDGEVKSADIGNNQVRSADVRDDTLSGGGLQGSDIAPGAITAADVAGESLTGDEVADESLTDADITDESLTGAVVANNSLTGDDISDSSTIGGNEINETALFNDNSLTGSDINESTLSAVPSASKVGNQSLQIINFDANNGSGASGGGSIGSGGGLGVTFSCAVATGDLSLSLRTAVDNASLAVSDDDSYFDVEDFDVADGDVDILTPLGGDSDEIINFVYVDGSGFGFHKVVTGQLNVLDEAPAGTQSECVVSGHAIFTV